MSSNQISHDELFFYFLQENQNRLLCCIRGRAYIIFSAKYTTSPTVVVVVHIHFLELTYTYPIEVQCFVSRIVFHLLGIEVNHWIEAEDELMYVRAYSNEKGRNETAMKL